VRVTPKDKCVCKHALDKHDEDGLCKHDCEACEEKGFRLDPRASPELTEGDLVEVLMALDRDNRTSDEVRRLEIALDKVSHQVFGHSLDELCSRGSKNRTA